MTREEQETSFDINGPGIAGNLFGLPYSAETARLIIMPVPWEATVTYRGGTSHAPEAVLRASRQVDFFHNEIRDAWKLGTAMLPFPEDILQESNKIKSLVQQHREGNAMDSDILQTKVNEACEFLNLYVKKTAQKHIEEGKVIGLLGGDHSSPLGLLRAISERHERFGILQIDAHADLRKSYEGFTSSHASIMYNALKTPSVSRLVQVGVRDWCEEEQTMINRGMGRVKAFFDERLKSELGSGKSWNSLCAEMIKDLPDKVYISFDIDGLDQKLCPQTGTPVPGGLEFHQAVSLIKAVATSGRQIIGFDLCEVSAKAEDEWDAIVASRMLWQLCCWTGVSHQFLAQQG